MTNSVKILAQLASNYDASKTSKTSLTSLGLKNQIQNTFSR